ncbi:hypothetical protein [Janthinobacterium sp. DSP2-3-3]
MHPPFLPVLVLLAASHIAAHAGTQADTPAEAPADAMRDLSLRIA